MKSYKGLVRRYVKNEKRSVVPIFISIILTICLITSVVFIVQNIMGNDFAEKKILFGDYDARFRNLDSEKVSSLKESENVKDYTFGKGDEILVTKKEGETKEESVLSYTGTYAVDKKFLDEYINLNVVEGRLPEKENEVVINKALMTAAPGEYKIGNSIQFNSRKHKFTEESYVNAFTQIFYRDTDKFNNMNVDERDKSIQDLVDKNIKVEDDKKVNYTIVGIIETDISDSLLGNKIVRLLTEDEKANKQNTLEMFTYLNDSSVTKLKSMAKELNIKYIPVDMYNDQSGYPGSDIRFVGYDKNSYTSIIKNGLSRNILLVIIAFCFMAVYNTFHTSVAKRIKVYGILRAIGGNMGQISYLIYNEAVLLFLAATPIGLALGYALAKVESYLLINQLGLLDSFIMNFNLELILITLISTLAIVGISVKSVLRKEGKLTPIEAVMDARGLTRTKKSLGKNLLGQSLSEGKDGKEDNKVIKELLDYDKKTFKFKVMKDLFKYEGELAHKNITRDAKPHKLTKSTLFMAMAILIFFFLQVVNGSVKAGDIVKSDKWDVELGLNNGQFNNDVINEIKNTDGVESVYKWSEVKLPIVVSNNDMSDGLKEAISYRPVEKVAEEKKTQGIVASLTTLDENSIKLYEGVDKEALDNGGVLLVNMGTSYIEKPSHMIGGGVDYSFINSNPMLSYTSGDKLQVSEDNSVLNKEGLEKYYEDNRKFNELNIVGTVDDDMIYSTANSTNKDELDFDVRLLTTEKGFNKIVGGSTNNKLVIKTDNVEKRADTIKELNRISAVNNYKLNDVIGSKLKLERNIKQDLGLNIIFAVTIVLMVILNLVNTSNASILARRKELAGMRAIGMSNSQERRMIIGELFYIALSVGITVIVSVGALSMANQSANLGAGKVSIVTLLLGEGLIILFLMIISNLTALGPLAQAKKFSIVEDLKGE